MNILNILLQISIYSGVIYAAIMLLKKVLNKKMSPLLHYGLWILLIVRLVMPFTVDSGLSLIQLPPSAAQVQQTVQTPPPSATADFGTQNLQTQADGNAAVQQPSNGLSDGTVQAQTVPQTEGAETLSLNAVLLSIWISGVCVCVVYLLTSYFLLRRRIMQNAQPATSRLAELFEMCKREMGIKADIRILSLYQLATPALLIPRTILMPMESLVSMDDAQIQFALRHELMHFRRRDHLASALLSILQAVYWFNPFVWLAFRQIRLDMEIACDNAVVRTMDRREKSSYAQLILGMFTKNTCQRMLGMAQGNTKKVAEKRIRGIYMDEKSRTSVKILSFVVTGILLIACFTTSCQPVAAQPALTDSSTGIFAYTEQPTPTQLAAPEQSAAPIVKYEAPQTWKETIELAGGKLKVNADATVTLPDVQTYPIYKAVEAPFTQEQINSLFKRFVGEKQLIKSPVQTKADVQKWIDELRKNQRVDAKSMAELQQEKQNAPETNQEVPVTDFSIADGKETIATIKLGDGTYGSLNFSDKHFGFTSGFGPDQESFRIQNGYDAIKGTYKITPEQAEAEAQKVLDEIGVTGMAVESIEKAYMHPIKQFAVNADSLKLAPKSKGYFITYVRVLGNIKTHQFAGGHGSTAMYTPPWMEEDFNLYIDEDGAIQYLYWGHPLRITDEVTSNTALLPFADIQNKIRSQLANELAFLNITDSSKIPVTLDQVALKMAMIDEKGKTDEAEYVPAWYVQYTIHYPANFVDNNGVRQTENKDKEYLVLNAIDGDSIATVPKQMTDAMNQGMQQAKESAAAQEAQQTAAPAPPAQAEASATQ